MSQCPSLKIVQTRLDERPPPPPSAPSPSPLEQFDVGRGK